MDPGSIPAGRIPAAVGEGTLRALDVTNTFLERIERLDPALNAFITVTGDVARSAAARLDDPDGRGHDPGLLAGVPVAVKDNIVTSGIPTTAGSRILEGHRPVYDASVVTRLREAGAILVGKTNLDEFGMGSSNENSAFGPTRNPWDPGRVPGGSSGASAAAVAAGMAPLALGSDTGGSIRQPAAFCGVYGLKPTYGRVSRYGLIAFASSLDQIGGFARDLPGLERLYRTLAGPDSRDSTCVDREVEPLSRDAGVSGLRVGLARTLLEHSGVQGEVAATVEAAARDLEAAGAAVRDVELPDPDGAIAAYYLVATAEASANLARYDGVRYGVRVAGDGLDAMYRATRKQGFGPEVKRRIMLGTYALSAGYYDAYYGKAMQARARIREALHEAFGELDLVLLPTTPTPAFALGERTGDPLSMYLADVFTVTASLAGIPALHVPRGTGPGGLPVGVQLLAPAWREDLLFRGAHALNGDSEVPAAPSPGGPAS